MDGRVDGDSPFAAAPSSNVNLSSLLDGFFLPNKYIFLLCCADTIYMYSVCMYT